jgi:hypothetical protein
MSPTKPLTNPNSASRSRTSLSPDTGVPRVEGRTPPPPAMSSGYAKRAWQLPTPDEGDDEIIGSGYRRARAGYVFLLPSLLLSFVLFQPPLLCSLIEWNSVVD